MSERRGPLCWCPLLAAASETERLAYMTGSRLNPHFGCVGPDTLLIGVPRDKHGCPGAHGGLGCYWSRMVGYKGSGLESDETGVPEVRPNKGDGPGVYL